MRRTIVSILATLFFIATMPAIADTHDFSSIKMAEVKLANLSFKELMRNFYKGKMSYVYINDDEVESMPFVGLGNVVDDDSSSLVALMHPIINYKNTSNQDRYLVTIEKVEVSNQSGALSRCNACKATAEVYIFKKTTNGEFQLVSKTLDDVEFFWHGGRVMLDNKKIQDGLQPLGKNLVGTLFENDDVIYGFYDAWFEALHLNENDYIRWYNLGTSSSNNGGLYNDDSPLHYDYSVSFEVVTDSSDYYPIKLTSKGDQGQSPEYVGSKIIKFDTAESKYK